MVKCTMHARIKRKLEEYRGSEHELAVEATEKSEDAADAALSAKLAACKLAAQRASFVGYKCDCGHPLCGSRPAGSGRGKKPPAKVSEWRLEHYRAGSRQSAQAKLDGAFSRHLVGAVQKRANFNVPLKKGQGVAKRYRKKRGGRTHTR